MTLLTNWGKWVQITCINSKYFAKARENLSPFFFYLKLLNYVETTFSTGRLRARLLFTSFGLVARHGTILMTGIALKSSDTSNKGVIRLI